MYINVFVDNITAVLWASLRYYTTTNNCLIGHLKNVFLNIKLYTYFYNIYYVIYFLHIPIL